MYSFLREYMYGNAEHLLLQLPTPTSPTWTRLSSKAVHSILVKYELSNDLPYRSLGFFSRALPRIYHVAPPRHETVMLVEVKKALAAVKIYNKHQSSSHRPTSNDDELVRPYPIFESSSPASKIVIEQTDKHIQDIAEAVAQQHGGILKHGSLKDLMNKIGNAIDVARSSKLL